MWKAFSVVSFFLLSGCAVWTVDPAELQRGDPGAMTFAVTGRPTYDQVWAAATKAMGNGMNIVDSHKPSGTIRSRVGANYTGKVVALFISPTATRAPQYTIEVVSKKPMGLGQYERNSGEPSVIDDFKAALNAK